MGTGFVGILSVELHFPGADSLKGKRKYMQLAKARLHDRLGLAVAEVDHHELWQRSRLTMACVTRDARAAGDLLDEAERLLESREFVLVSRDRNVVTLDD